MSDIDDPDEIMLTISRKHGEMLIGTLRKTYGYNFAPHCADHEKLSDVFYKLDVNFPSPT